VRFGPWLPIERAQAQAAAGPGVLQTRGDALLPLPRGKSAMILYAASGDDESLADFVQGPGAARLAAARALGARWIRFGSAPRPQHELDRLLRQFRERFGALPPANEEMIDVR
jgi:hypothetical protein